MCNIYRNSDNEFYFSEKKENKKDLLIENDISYEFAFNYCAKKNFGEEISKSGSKVLAKTKNSNYNKQNVNARTKSIRRQNSILYYVCTGK